MATSTLPELGLHSGLPLRTGWPWQVISPLCAPVSPLGTKAVNCTSLRQGGEGACSVAQSCPTLCDRMDCSRPGSSVHGILQARVLEWGAIASSRGSYRPRD